MRCNWWCVGSAAAMAAGAFAQPATTGEATPSAEQVQDAAHPKRLKLSLLWENDADYFTLFDTEDANYTNGIRIDAAWTPEFAQRWAEALPLAGGFRDMRSAAGVAVGQNMYSPDAIQEPDAPPDEHPWGVWLYAGFYLQRADATKLDTLELDLGVTGEWAGGELAQKQIHRLLESPDPKGWSNQNEDEVGVNLVFQRTWKVGWGPRPGWRTEVLPYAGATLGTIYTNAIAGATLRLGWNIADDFGMARIGQMADQTVPPADGFGFYVFGRAGGRLVAHDTFLDGSLFQDGPSVDKEPLVGEGQVGAALRLCRWFELYYSQTWWTEEFETEGRGQHFGSWGFRMQFEY